MNEFEKKNQEALQALEDLNYSVAQACFFENAKRVPCHETFNNLGYYLITEGLWCKNNNARNALALGLKYLLKACELRITPINLCAIATAIHYGIEKGRENHLGIYTYQNAYAALNHAVKLQYTNETEYNRLRFLYLCDMKSMEVLNGMKRLIEHFVCPDSVYFYLFLLCLHDQFDECLKAIPRYRHMLDEADLMTFYCICGEYQKGAVLFEVIQKQFCLDEERTAMMVECLTRNNMTDKIHQYQATVVEQNQETKGLFPWLSSCGELVFGATLAAGEYRQGLISNYQVIPAYIHQCCYFGCRKHGNVIL